MRRTHMSPSLYSQIINGSCRQPQNYAAQISIRPLSLMSSIGLGVGGIFMVANIGFVASAIPAVLGKGAPYLPTLKKSLDIIFQEALPQLLPIEMQQSNKRISVQEESKSETKSVIKDEARKVPLVIDLGSGDGRVVIEAAKYGYRSIGYELNPGLVGISQVWATYDRYAPNTTPWLSTGSASFYTRDLWSVNLEGADVIFVYGLSPIMERLSKKILDEAPHSIVVSNVFEMDPKLWKKVFDKWSKNI